MRVLPVGEDALLVEVTSGEEAQALHAELLRRRAEGSLRVGEIVPAARTVLLDGLTDPHRTAAELTAADIPPVPPRARETVEIPVRYDGPDLADVAAHWGVAVEEVARIHAGTEFHVAFCGFAPGFGYMTGLPPRYDVPRRSTPRTTVPAGAVALAGPYTGVYPRSSPGGWQLIGTTDTVLWDPTRTPAALLSPGTRVRFVPVDEVGPAAEGPGAVRAKRAGEGSDASCRSDTPNRSATRPRAGERTPTAPDRADSGAQAGAQKPAGAPGTASAPAPSAGPAGVA